MKTTILMIALLGAALGTQAQNNKEHKVRIRKVENINGVEKITDTTMMLSAEEFKKMHDIESRLANLPHPPAPPDSLMNRRFMVKTREVEPIDIENRTKKAELLAKQGDHYRIIKTDEQLTPEEKAELIKAIEEGGNGNGKMEVIIREDKKVIEENGEKVNTMTKVIIVNKCKVLKPEASEEQMLNKSTGVSDNKLEMSEMNFYPNPSDGKFNLTFTLPGKGLTEVSVLDNQGKLIYNEKLTDFSGQYNKSIDISRNPKGIYFVKVSQGQHSSLKKIVLE